MTKSDFVKLGRRGAWYLSVVWYGRIVRMRQRGFTLVELLVVIAIIGLLSSVVFASLNSARTKGADAVVKQQLSSMRSAAALLFENTGTFDTLCDAATDTGKMYRNAYEKGTKVQSSSLCMESDASGSLFDITGVTVATPAAGKWAAVVHLRGGGYFCVDYRGTAQVQPGRGLDNAPTDYEC